MTGGEFEVFDVATGQSVGRRRLYADAVSLCENIVKNEKADTTCRRCKHCNIMRIGKFAEQHFCEVHKELLHDLKPCELWEVSSND